jgi:DNA-binding transcriptional LysR family regulator
VIEAMDEAERVVSGTEAEASGRLIVHTALTTAKYLLAPVLPALLERHPKLQIEFVIGIERGDFIKQGLDVAIHSGRPTELSLIARPLMRRRWAIVAAPSYLKKYGTPQTPGDLLQHRCLNFTVRTHWNTWSFREAGALKTVAVPNHVSANQGELLRACALAGLGVARLVHCSVAADLQAGTLAPLLEDFREQTEDTLYVLYPRGKVQAPRVKAFLAFLDEKFGQSRI